MNEELESTNAELQAINTDLRLRTDEVARLNTFLRAITGNIDVGAAVIDTEMHVQVWNEMAADLWGLRSDEVVGKPFFDLDIGFPVEDIRTMVRAVMNGQPAHDSTVVEATNRRGRSIQLRVMVHALSDGERPTGVVVVMEDVRAGQPSSG